MKKRATVYCVCNKAMSRAHCLTVCTKGKKIKPDVTMYHPAWKQNA